MALLSGMSLAADPAPKPPAKVVIEQRRVDVAPDASQVTVTHYELQILATKAIQPLGQQPINYAEGLQELEINEAYTLKADGTKIPVLPNAVITQQRPSTSGTPMLTDQKQKVVVYPNVEVGDTLVSTRTLKSKPLFPGLFSSTITLRTTIPVGKSEIVFATPKSMPLYIDAKDVVVEKSTDGDKLLYTIRDSNDKYSASVQYVSALDVAPHVFVSTFKTWGQFTKTYAAMLLPKMAVTPKLQAKADEITAGITDRREQVKKIYDWVSTHIRYVGIEFGQGGFVPHDPEDVMVNTYGDCKDHSILFATLLKAKGIPADLVTIHAGDNYTVANVPVPGTFNHMINYVPSLSMYVDTTQRTQPFGYLTRPEYGKTVVHVTTDASPVHTVPVLAEKDYNFSYVEHQKLEADGRLIADGTLTANGVAAGQARREGTHLRGIGTEKSAVETLEKRGLADAVGRYMLPPESETATPEYKATMHYEAPMQSVMLSAPFAISKGLTFASLNDEFWLGPIAADKYKRTDILPCYSGTSSEDYTLELPAGKKLAALPADAKIEADGLSYTTHWSLTGHVVSVHRALALHFTQPLCRGPQRAAIGVALAKIKTDLGTLITLVAE
jgi:transglutaminase-like putative cysteine protease